MKYVYSFSISLLFIIGVSISGIAIADKLDMEGAKALFNQTSENQPDFRCFKKNIFETCMSIWGDSRKTNKNILMKLHQITQESPVRSELEVFLEQAEFLGMENIRTETIDKLQQTYRKDASQSGNAHFFLKSYKLRSNDGDMESFISAATVDEVAEALKENILGNQKYRAIALNKFRATSGPKGGFYAYRITGEIAELHRAIKLTSTTRTDIADKIFDEYLSTVVGVRQLPDFISAVDACLGCSHQDLSTKALKIPGFGNNLNVKNFLDSVEYRFVLKKHKPKITSRLENNSYGLQVAYSDKDFDFSELAKCELSSSYSVEKELGIFQGIGNAIGGGKVKSKNVHYNVYKCFPAIATLSSFYKLENALTGSTSETEKIKEQSGWEYHDESGEVSYNRFSGSNGGVRSVNNVNKDGKLWNVICNSGASGMVTIDSINSAMYCASGAAKDPKCEISMGVNAGAEYLCQ